MRKFFITLAILIFTSSLISTAQTPMQIYGAWHCGSDFCTWSSVRNMTDFDTKNHWIIDRGDGSGQPSVNLIVLSFVNPLRLLNKTNDAGDVNGVPIGMTQSVVNYFASHGIRTDHDAPVLRCSARSCDCDEPRDLGTEPFGNGGCGFSFLAVLI